MYLIFLFIVFLFGVFDLQINSTFKFSFCDPADFVLVIRWLISLTDFILLHFQEARVFIEGI